jgi:hypothetical protein
VAERRAANMASMNLLIILIIPLFRWTRWATEGADKVFLCGC